MKIAKAGLEFDVSPDLSEQEAAVLQSTRVTPEQALVMQTAMGRLRDNAFSVGFNVGIAVGVAVTLLGLIVGTVLRGIYS